MIKHSVAQRPALSRYEPTIAVFSRRKRRHRNGKWPLHMTFAFVAGFNLVAWSGFVALGYVIL